MADNGIVQRAIAMVRYAITGNAPAEWFGPSQPLTPMAPEEVKGRQYDYPVAINLNYLPRSGEAMGFAKLKALAENSDILRIVMDGQKDKIEAQEWTIKPREQAGKKGEADQSVREIEALLQYPDRNLDWPQWLRALLEQLFVLDAVSIYRRRDLGGRPYSFEILDGAMIKVLLDQSGRRPMSPSPAYQQILKGVVAADFTTDELLYYPQNVRADRAYGMSRVQQIVTVVETQIQRLKHQKAFFTHGNLSDGFFSAPAGTTGDQVRQVEQMWNALLAQGDVESRRVNQFLPGGFEWNAIGAPPLQDEFDQWLARIICFTFSTSPTPFLKQTGMGHGSAETQHEAAESAGLANLMSYVRRIMNRLLTEDFKRPDLEFSWVEDREFDPEVKAKIEDMRLKNGSLILDEVRDRNGEDPLPNGAGAKPMVYTASGPVLLDDVINPPEPVAPPVAPPAHPNAPPAPAADESPGKEPKAPLEKAMSKAAAEKAIAKTVADYLAAKAGEIAAVLAPALGLAKAAPADDTGADGFASRIDAAMDDIDWNWTDLAPKLQPALTGIAVAAGKSATSELGLFDKSILAKMTADATAYAEARAAEMVGMKLVDGELVENEGWSIPAATRDMVRSAVTQAMEEGASNQELAKSIEESDAFSKARASTIARTETANADVQGKITGWKASGLVGGKQFVAAPDCCDECQACDGEIVGLDEEFTAGDPPIHPQCLPGDTLVLASGIAAVSERPFEGNVVVIGTASGKRLTCTPNHPILTPSGWVAAGLLNVGDDVISTRLGDWVPGSAVGDDAENVPARIEDVAEAFRRSGKVAAVEVPVSAPDFHGDGEGSEVAIIWSDRLLVDRADAPGCKYCGKPLLAFGDMEASAHDGAGVLDLLVEPLGAPSCGAMGTGDLGFAGGAIHRAPLEQFGLTAATPLNAVLSKDAGDWTPADSELIGERLLGSAGDIEAANLALVDFQAGSQGDVSVRKGRVEHGGSDASPSTGLLRAFARNISADSLVELVRRRFGPSDMASGAQGATDAGFREAVCQSDFSQSFTGEIFRDHIVDVRLNQFSGHVYNLETNAGFYIAEGIVTHNCRCDIEAVLNDEMGADEEA